MSPRSAGSACRPFAVRPPTAIARRLGCVVRVRRRVLEVFLRKQGPSHYGPYQAVRLAWFAVREDTYVYLYPCDTAVTKPQDAAAALSGSPDHYATRGVGCAIVPGAECPIWEEFLHRSLPAGTAETLQEWFGAGLIHGKIRALRKGLISARCSAAIRSASGPGHGRRFGMQPLIGCSGWVAETPSACARSSTPKPRRPPSPARARRSSGRTGPRWNAHYDIPVFLTMNNYPVIKDDSDACYNRSLGPADVPPVVRGGGRADRPAGRGHGAVRRLELGIAGLGTAEGARPVRPAGVHGRGACRSFNRPEQSARGVPDALRRAGTRRLCHARRLPADRPTTGSSARSSRCGPGRARRSGSRSPTTTNIKIIGDEIFVAVHLQDALELGQVRGRMLALAVLGVEVDHRRWGACRSRAGRRRRSPTSGRSWSRPRPGSSTGKGVSSAKMWVEPRTCRCSRRHRGSSHQHARPTQSHRGGAVELDPVPGEDLRLPIERQVITELGHQHVREERLGGHPARDRPLRGRSLRHGFFTDPTAVAGSADHLHPQLGGDDVEHLARVLADQVQAPAAARTALVLEVDEDLDPRQVRRQGARLRRRDRDSRGVLLLAATSSCAASALPGLLEVLEAELQLVGVEPLRAPAELPRCSCRSGAAASRSRPGPLTLGYSSRSDLNGASSSCWVILRSSAADEQQQIGSH